MKHIELVDDLSLKKIDIEESKDLWLIRKLDQEQNEFFYPIENIFKNEYKNREYLNNESLYNAPFGIYYRKNPIGYLQTALIKKSKIATLACKVLEMERKKGYATKTVKELTRKMLMDTSEEIKKVLVAIDIENERCKKVVIHAGFKGDILSKVEQERNGVVLYEKTKRMLKLERLQ